MRDLNFQDSGCERDPGSRSAVVAARRGLRALLRPAFGRLAQILESLADRLDRAEELIRVVLRKIDREGARQDTVEAAIHTGNRRLAAVEFGLNAARQRVDLAEDRAGAAESRITAAESRITAAETRTTAAETRLTAAETRNSALEVRLDDGERRHISAEWNLAALHQKAQGLADHLAGLTAEHRALFNEMRSRDVQINTLSESILDLGRRHDELAEKLQAIHALHWDHVALAHRLAVIEDLLSVARTEDSHPLLPFPGLDDEEELRARVG